MRGSDVFRMERADRSGSSVEMAGDDNRSPYGKERRMLSEVTEAKSNMPPIHERYLSSF